MNKIHIYAPMALLLVSCGQQSENDPVSVDAAISQQDDAICEKAPPTATNADECVHRESYLLASAEGEIRDIAVAVVERCNAEIMLRATNDKPPSAKDNMNEWMSAIQKHYTEKAVMRVAESRAGKCDKPE